jgi:hypothetical protein
MVTGEYTIIIFRVKYEKIAESGVFSFFFLDSEIAKYTYSVVTCLLG